MTDENRFKDLPWDPPNGKLGPIILTKLIPDGGCARYEPLPEGAIRCTIILPDFEIDRDRWANLMNLLKAREARKP